MIITAEARSYSAGLYGDTGRLESGTGDGSVVQLGAIKMAGCPQMGVPAQARAGHGTVSVRDRGLSVMQTVVVCLLVFHCFCFPHFQFVVVVVDPQPAHGSIFNLKSTTKRETHKKTTTRCAWKLRSGDWKFRHKTRLSVGSRVGC